MELYGINMKLEFNEAFNEDTSFVPDSFIMRFGKEVVQLDFEKVYCYDSDNPKIKEVVVKKPENKETINVRNIKEVDTIFIDVFSNSQEKTLEVVKVSEMCFFRPLGEKAIETFDVPKEMLENVDFIVA